MSVVLPVALPVGAYLRSSIVACVLVRCPGDDGLEVKLESARGGRAIDLRVSERVQRRRNHTTQHT